MKRIHVFGVYVCANDETRASGWHAAATELLERASIFHNRMFGDYSKVATTLCSSDRNIELAKPRDMVNADMKRGASNWLAENTDVILSQVREKCPTFQSAQAESDMVVVAVFTSCGPRDRSDAAFSKNLLMLHRLHEDEGYAAIQSWGCLGSIPHSDRVHLSVFSADVWRYPEVWGCDMLVYREAVGRPMGLGRPIVPNSLCVMSRAPLDAIGCTLRSPELTISPSLLAFSNCAPRRPPDDCWIAPSHGTQDAFMGWRAYNPENQPGRIKYTDLGCPFRLRSDGVVRPGCGLAGPRPQDDPATVGAFLWQSDSLIPDVSFAGSPWVEVKGTVDAARLVANPSSREVADRMVELWRAEVRQGAVEVAGGVSVTPTAASRQGPIVMLYAPHPAEHRDGVKLVCINAACGKGFVRYMSSLREYGEEGEWICFQVDGVWLGR